MEREDNLLALVLGQTLLEYGKSLDTAALVAQVKSDAEKCLIEIARIMNREELSDFECVEEIVTHMEQMGFDTSRHDFG